VNGAPLAFAFGAGMLATVNPCGFSLLPAYLTYFLGLDPAAGDAGATPQGAGVLRAFAVSAAMTAGFVAVFGAVGFVITQIGSSVQRHLPYVTVVIGLGLVVLGAATLRGRYVRLPLPSVRRSGGERGLGSMAVFGVSYALSSLSCTIGPFLAATSSTFSDAGFLAGVSTFVAYALGMGAVVTALTVAVASARTSMVARFRSSSRWVQPASGVLLVLAGAYTAYYGWYELRLRSGIVRDPIVDAAIDVQESLQSTISGIGTGTLGVICAAVCAVALTATLLRRARRQRV